jgi:hypothetical protein
VQFLNQKQEKPNEQPSGKIKEGNVTASIFEIDGPKGKFRTATIQLRHKNKDGDWQTGSSYGHRICSALKM